MMDAIRKENKEKGVDTLDDSRKELREYEDKFLNKVQYPEEAAKAEARKAVDWLLGRRTSAEFRNKLKQVLERIGHEELAQEI